MSFSHWLVFYVRLSVSLFGSWKCHYDQLLAHHDHQENGRWRLLNSTSMFFCPDLPVAVNDDEIRSYFHSQWWRHKMTSIKEATVIVDIITSWISNYLFQDLYESQIHSSKIFMTPEFVLSFWSFHWMNEISSRKVVDSKQFKMKNLNWMHKQTFTNDSDSFPRIFFEETVWLNDSVGDEVGDEIQ